MTRQWTAHEPYLAVQGELLEGPLYDEARGQCRFIDILDQKLYTFSLSEGPDSLKVISTEETLGVTANITGTDKEQIVAARSGFALLNSTTGTIKYIKKVWDAAIDGPAKEKIMRFNDGAVDCRGRFWAGAMTDPKLVTEGNREGCLFRLDADLAVHRVLTHVGTPNGIGWNAANTVMYWTDSVDRSIYAFDFDAETGEVSNQRELWNARAAGWADGINPDGLVVDVEDCVWIALWRGSKVLRINPDGVVVGEVALPTAYVTCPVFLGSDLVITTARDPSVQDSGIKRGGDVYRVHVGVRGLPKYEFTMLA